jgi:hypothetical protein
LLDPWRALSPREVRIANELLLGISDTEIAARERLHRSTIWRIKNQPTVQAFLNQAKRAYADGVAMRLLQLARRCVEIIETDVANGNLSAALAVVRGLGLLPGTPLAIGPGDPEEILAQEEIREHELQVRWLQQSGIGESAPAPSLPPSPGRPTQRPPRRPRR